MDHHRTGVPRFAAGLNPESSLFTNFLAGNETFNCTPWGKRARIVFGWQGPCYLLGESPPS
jgi:Domain of unknown function (DUF3463)